MRASPGRINLTDPVEWGHPLNQGRVAWWLGLPDSGHWGGAVLRDLCRRFPGTLVNGPTWTPTGRGDVGLNFVASSSQSVAGGGSLGSPTVLTVAAWVRPTTVSGTSTILGWASPGGPQFRYEGGGALRWVKQQQADIGSGTSGVVVAGVWQRVVGSYDSSTGAYAFWKNGVAAGGGTNAQTLTYSNYTISLGAGGSEHADAVIADLTVWDGRYFAAADVALDYDLSRRVYAGPDSPIRRLSGAAWFVGTGGGDVIVNATSVACILSVVVPGIALSQPGTPVLMIGGVVQPVGILNQSVEPGSLTESTATLSTNLGYANIAIVEVLSVETPTVSGSVIPEIPSPVELGVNVTAPSSTLLYSGSPVPLVLTVAIPNVSGSSIIETPAATSCAITVTPPSTSLSYSAAAVVENISAVVIATTLGNIPGSVAEVLSVSVPDTQLTHAGDYATVNLAVTQPTTGRTQNPESVILVVTLPAFESALTLYASPVEAFLSVPEVTTIGQTEPADGGPVWSVANPRVWNSIQPRVWIAVGGKMAQAAETLFLSIGESKTFGFDFSKEGAVKSGETLSTPTAAVTPPTGAPTLNTPEILDEAFSDSGTGGKTIQSGKGARMRIEAGSAGTFTVKLAVLTSGGDTLNLVGKLTVK